MNDFLHNGIAWCELWRVFLFSVLQLQNCSMPPSAHDCKLIPQTQLLQKQTPWTTNSVSTAPRLPSHLGELAWPIRTNTGHRTWCIQTWFPTTTSQMIKPDPGWQPDMDNRSLMSPQRLVGSCWFNPKLALLFPTAQRTGVYQGEAQDVAGMRIHKFRLLDWAEPSSVNLFQNDMHNLTSTLAVTTSMESTASWHMAGFWEVRDLHLKSAKDMGVLLLYTRFLQWWRINRYFKSEQGIQYSRRVTVTMYNVYVHIYIYMAIGQNPGT